MKGIKLTPALRRAIAVALDAPKTESMDKTMNKQQTEPIPAQYHTAIDAKADLQDMRDDEKVTIVMTRPEYEYLMDLIDRQIHNDISPRLHEELDKKKMNERAVQCLQAERRSIGIIKERLMDAVLPTL